MPVKTEGSRVVADRAVGRFEDGLDEVLHGFLRVHLRTPREQRDGPLGWRLDKPSRSALIDGVIALGMAVEVAEQRP